MKEIMRIEGGDDLEKVIQQAKSLHSPGDKKENNERLTLYGFLRKASPLLERPVTVIHGDKPDFILTTPTQRIGLESRLISTPALEHASHLHDSTFGHQCINTTDFLLTKERMRRQEVQARMLNHGALPGPAALSDLDREWYSIVVSSMMEKTAKRNGYTADLDRFGLLFLDCLSFNFQELSERVCKHEGELRALIVAHSLWVLCFRASNESLLLKAP